MNDTKSLLPANVAKLMGAGIPQRMAVSLAMLREPAGSAPAGKKPR